MKTQSKKIPAQSVSRARSISRLGLTMIGSWLLGLALFAAPELSEGASIPTTIPNTKGTKLRADGIHTFVSGSNGTTEVYMDEYGTWSVVWHIPGGGGGTPPQHGAVEQASTGATQGVAVMGNNAGQLITINPATGTATVLASAPGQDWRFATADSRDPTIMANLMDANTGIVHQIDTTGAIITVGVLSIAAPVEIVEKQFDSTSSTAFDDYLLVAGSQGGMAAVEAFDRATFSSTGVSLWAGAPSEATGIDSTEGAFAFVSSESPGGSPGYLVRLDLSTMTFDPAAAYTFTNGADDVSISEDFIAVVGTASSGTGVDITLFDYGDGINVIHAGTYTDTTATSDGGLDTYIGEGGTREDLMTTFVEQTTGVIGHGATFTQDDANFTEGTPPTVVPGVDPNPTPSEGGMLVEDSKRCQGPCPPDDETGSGQTGASPSGAATSDKVLFSTGEEMKVEPILSVPGTGLDVSIYLTYRSRKDYDFRYGKGWFLNHDVRVRTETNGDVTFFDGSGRGDTFVKAGGSFIAPMHYDTNLTSAGGTTTLTNRVGSTSTFDAQGRRTQVADRYGNTLSYTWVGDQLISIVDTHSRTYTLTYDVQGRLSSITDFGGRSWVFQYDYMGQLKSITTPASTQFPNGRTRRFSYTGSEVDPYLTSNLVHCWSPKGDKVQTLVYDEWDRVTEEFVGEDSYQISYNALLRQTTVVDRSGNTTQWTFDVASMPVKEEVFTKGLRVGEPVSYVTTWQQDSNGNVAHTVLPRGNRVDYTYDALQNTIEIRRKDSNSVGTSATDIVVQRTFAGPYSQQTQSIDANLNTTTYTLDGLGNVIGVTHPTVTSPASQPVSESFTWDAKGRLLTATDPAGRSTWFEYYTTGVQNGYLHRVRRDPTGLSLTTIFDYDQFGNVISVTDPNGNTTTLSVDTESYPTQITAPTPFSFARKITYDANRNVTRVETENRDRNGALDGTTPWIAADMDYDELGRLTARTVQLTAASSAVTGYEYEGSGIPSKITSATGSETTIEYDERRLLFKATLGFGTPDAATIRIDYDENGNAVTTHDALGNTSAGTYDLFDRRTRSTSALGHYTEVTFDKASNALTIEAKDSGGTLLAKATNHHDELHRLWKYVSDRFAPGLSTTYPTTTITRDASGLVTAVQDPMSNTSSYTYDASGRLAVATDAVGNKIENTYDANGNVTRRDRTDIPAGGGTEVFSTEFVFDELNRLTTTKEVDRLNTSNILTTTMEYDSRGNLTFRTDAEGHPKRWSYDLASRLTKFERALQIGTAIDDFVQAIEERFEYDADSRLTEVSDDNFNDTTYLYDALHRQTRTTYANSGQVNWTYDENGNAKTRTDQNGTSVSNSYDGLNRLTSRAVTLGSGVTGTTLETFGYDALGRTTYAADDDYQLEFTWDSVGNLLQERQGYMTTGSEKWKTVKTSYNDAGASTGLTYPSMFQLGHQRDAIYRLTALQDTLASVNVSSHTWQGSGRLATTTNQNGTSTDYTYDGFGRTATIDHVNGSAQSFHKFEYAYDKVHNRRMEKNSYNAAWMASLPTAAQTWLNGRNGKGNVYAYDMAYRMIDARFDVTNPLTEVATPGSQTYASMTAYTIDGLGNRSQTAATVGGTTTTTTYAADVINQYTAVGGVSRTHDGSGNLTDDGNQKYVFDYANRLCEVKSSSTSATIATYKFDALGRRVEKDVAGGAVTRYVLDGQSIVEEYDGADAWQARYMHEDRIDHVRAMDRLDIADVDSDANTTEVQRFHYHQQALGSVTELTMSTGAVVEWAMFDAYGKATIRASTGTAVAASAIGNPFAFTGRELDSESGLMHYRARAYDPENGRFLQRDPLHYVDGPNDRDYVSGRPSSSTDPLGLHERGAAGPAVPGPHGPPDQEGENATDELTEKIKAIADRLHETIRDLKKAHFTRRQCKKDKWSWVDEVFRALADVLRAMDDAIAATIDALVGAALNAIVEAIMEALPEGAANAVLDGLEAVADALSGPEEALKAALGGLPLTEDQREVLVGLVGIAIGGKARGSIADRIREAIKNAKRRGPRKKKPGRKKQGREGGEKKRQKPGWRPHGDSPPKEPPPHTPSRKD